MTIYDLLTSGKKAFTISRGNRWLFWNRETKEWIVRVRYGNTGDSFETFRSRSEHEAVKTLTL